MKRDASASPSFYKRPLPEGNIAFSSDEGRAIFREALGQGTMEGFFVLAEQFHTQAEPAFCGLGTLVMVLNALAIDPGRAWKGPWRWYSEEHLDCCRPLEDVAKDGITLTQLAGAELERFLRDLDGADLLVLKGCLADGIGAVPRLARILKDPDGLPPGVREQVERLRSEMAALQPSVD